MRRRKFSILPREQLQVISYDQAAGATGQCPLEASPPRGASISRRFSSAAMAARDNAPVGFGQPESVNAGYRAP